MLKLVLEVAMISVGVFLGLAGEQWREHTHQRELAIATQLLSYLDFLAALYLYYNDMMVYEPRLMKMYDQILPKIDTTLGGK